MRSFAYDLGYQAGIDKEAFWGAIAGGAMKALPWAGKAWGRAGNAISGVAGKALSGSGKALSGSGKAVTGARQFVQGVAPNFAGKMGIGSLASSKGQMMLPGMGEAASNFGRAGRAGAWMKRHPIWSLLGADAGIRGGIAAGALPEWSRYATLPAFARMSPIAAAGIYAGGEYMNERANTQMGQQLGELGQYAGLQDQYIQQMQQMQQQGRYGGSPIQHMWQGARQVPNYYRGVVNDWFGGRHNTGSNLGSYR